MPSFFFFFFSFFVNWTTPVLQDFLNINGVVNKATKCERCHQTRAFCAKITFGSKTGNFGSARFPNGTFAHHFFFLLFQSSPPCYYKITPLLWHFVVSHILDHYTTSTEDGLGSLLYVFVHGDYIWDMAAFRNMVRIQKWWWLERVIHWLAKNTVTIHMWHLIPARDTFVLAM